MLLSLSLLLLVGLLFGWLFSKLKLPYIIGMLFAGIVLGPHLLNLFDPRLLQISGDLRKIALIIIIAKSGFSLDIDDLKAVGRPALMLCFFPAIFEILAFVLFAPSLLGVTRLEAGIMGAVMGAVSPAITVPRLSSLIDNRWGTAKGIPQMLVAAGSADDILVMVIFTSLVNLEVGGDFSFMTVLDVPVTILLGIAAGVVLALLLLQLFKHLHLRDSLKVVIIMAFSLLLYGVESFVPLSGLLGVMTIGLVIRKKNKPLAQRLSLKYSKLWVAAEIFLFVLVGASIDVEYMFSSGLMMIVMLFIGLLFREAGTLVSLAGTRLNRKERLFALISEVPKATVQAAIGSVPLAMGLGCGEMVLTLAVISIIITAPLGAFGMDFSYRRLLTCDGEKQ